MWSSAIDTIEMSMDGWCVGGWVGGWEGRPDLTMHHILSHLEATHTTVRLKGQAKSYMDGYLRNRSFLDQLVCKEMITDQFKYSCCVSTSYTKYATLGKLAGGMF